MCLPLGGCCNVCTCDKLVTRDLYYCESVCFYDMLHTHLKSDQKMGTECEEYAFSMEEVGSDT